MYTVVRFGSLLQLLIRWKLALTRSLTIPPMNCQLYVIMYAIEDEFRICSVYKYYVYSVTLNMYAGNMSNYARLIVFCNAILIDNNYIWGLHLGHSNVSPLI